jgi:hypothetical protein
MSLRMSRHQGDPGCGFDPWSGHGAVSIFSRISLHEIRP